MSENPLNINEDKKEIKQEGDSDKIKFGVCPICKVRDNDSSIKKLFKCKYCGEYFCEKHITPKLILDFKQIERLSIDPLSREELIKEWRREDRHPDKNYTLEFFRKLEESERLRQEMLERLTEFEKKYEKKEVESKTEESIKEKFIKGIKNLEKIFKEDEKEEVKDQTEVIKEDKQKLEVSAESKKEESKSQEETIKEDKKEIVQTQTNVALPPKKTKGNIIKRTIFYILIIIIVILLISIYVELDKYKLFFDPGDSLSFEPPFFFRIFEICPDNYSYKDGKCHYFLNNTPIIRKFTYCWFGELRELSVVLHKEANEYFNKVAKKEACDSNLEDFYLKSIKNKEQEKYIKKLVEEIKKIPTSSDNWVRIAVSLVQNIPYDYSRLYDSGYSCEYTTIFFFVIDKSAKGTVPRYPYNVLYENKGVCNEKSRLLAAILKELGYGVVLLEFTQEKHMAVGIKCPKKYANYIYNNTGYCFIETTKPSIITHNTSEYVGVGRLYSEPKIIFVSDGKSFESVYMEYQDARRYEELLEISRKNYNVLPYSLYDEWLRITKKYCIQASS